MRFIRILPIPGRQGAGGVYAENTTMVVPRNPLTVFRTVTGIWPWVVIRM
jgi:hypothetical protein